MYSLTNFGNQIKDKRKKNNLTLENLAEISGISKTELYNIEAGKTTPNVKILYDLSFYLHCDLKHLMDNSSTEIEQTINEIRCEIECDLSRREYSDLSTYLERLDTIYDSLKYDSTNLEHIKIFETIERLQIWLTVIIKYSLGQKEEALADLKNSLMLEKTSNYDTYLNTCINDTIDLNINSTYCGLNNECYNFSAVTSYYKFLTINYLNGLDYGNRKYFFSIYLRVAYNYISYLLEEEKYDAIIAESINIIKLIQAEKIGCESSQFYLMKELAIHQLYNDNLNGIKEALNLFKFERKKHLIPTLVNNLEKYNIYIKY